MSALAEVAERFGAGDLVLIGDERDECSFLAAAAQDITERRLRRLYEIGGGMVVLGLAEEIAQRLELPEPQVNVRRRVRLDVSTPIDAATGISGGWSLQDRAYTMRVAASPDSLAGDIAIPGHVHPLLVDRRRAGHAAATIELCALSGISPAVALCPLVDRQGVAVALGRARRRAEVAKLPWASMAELHSYSVTRHSRAIEVACGLPTRAGLFRACGYPSCDDDRAIVTLIHGDPVARRHSLVHVHAACLLGDAFGSLLCDCRAELDRAIETIVGDGAGVIIYSKSLDATPTSCGRAQVVEPGLVAGLLRAAGVRTLRISPRSAWMAEELALRGLELA